MIRQTVPTPGAASRGAAASRRRHVVGQDGPARPRAVKRGDVEPALGSETTRLG